MSDSDVVPMNALSLSAAQRVIEAAIQRQLPHVYLGYYVTGCRSLEYKDRFRPNEALGPAGEWVAFRQ